MKQLDFYNLLSDLTLDEVFAAYFDCRKKKRRTVSSLRFEMHYEKNLIHLWQDIINRRYHIASSTGFIVTKPVLREVFAANFKDRIVHHLVISRVNTLFEQLFSDYSFSCRAGKGTLCAVRSVFQMIRECSKSYTQDCYVLRLDIQGYFFHIDKTILKNKIHTVVEQNYFRTDKSTVIYLLDAILDNNPIKSCRLQSSSELWNELPKTKSLFYSNPHCGLPIGNLTSQIFANLYLNDFDHYVEGLDKDLFYARYVDDLVLIHPSREFLLNAKQLLQTYLHNNLKLDLHPKKVSLQDYRKGFLFVGAYILPDRIYPGKRLQKSFFKKIEKLNHLWEAEATGKTNLKLINMTLSSINSYFGLLKYFDAWRIKLKGWNMLSQKIRDQFFADADFHKISLTPHLRQEKLDRERLFVFGPKKHKKKKRRNPFED